MRQQVNPFAQSLSPCAPGTPTEESARELGIRNPVHLASNENPRGAGDRVQSAIRSQLGTLSRYPDPFGLGLKRSLAARLGVDADQITLGNGSNEVLDLATRAILVPESEAIVDQTCFMLYPMLVAAAGGKVVRVASRDWGHDLPEMLNRVTDATRMVFIANPNNPTGTWSHERNLLIFLRTISERVWVVLDEAYFEYAAPMDGYESGVGWISEFPNLVVTRTFSKIHGLAGMRIGYSVSSPGFADLLNRVRPPFNVSRLGLAAAEAAICEDEFIKESETLNRSGMQRVRSELANLGYETLCSAGNFVTMRCQQPALSVYERLLARGVIVRPVASYGMPDHLRVTIGLPEENERFLDALATIQ